MIKSVQILAPLMEKKFYLAGGTGLALRCGHRISVDLDLFSKTNKLGQIERRKIISSLKGFELNIVENTDNTIHMILEGVAISLFYYDYPILVKLKDLWRNIPIASLEDILCMKLSAILGRGSKKD